MRRRAKRGEFRSSLHRGGRGRPVGSSRRTWRRRSGRPRSWGWKWQGWICSETREGPTLLEVNSSPGFEGLERATGLDAAGAIIDRALALSGPGNVATRRAL